MTWPPFYDPVPASRRANVKNAAGPKTAQKHSKPQTQNPKSTPNIPKTFSIAFRDTNTPGGAGGGARTRGFAGHGSMAATCRIRVSNPWIFAGFSATGGVFGHMIFAHVAASASLTSAPPRGGRRCRLGGVWCACVYPVFAVARGDVGICFFF